MIYKGKEYKTMDSIFHLAWQLAKEDKSEAQLWFKNYIDWIYQDNPKVNSIKEAERIAKSNLGYYAGYFNAEVCNIIYKTYDCCHPIFGNEPFNVSPKEAFELGEKHVANLS